MDGVTEFLERVRQQHLAKGHLRGLLHVLIGRRLALADGTVVSAGLTWRQLSEILRDLRWDKDQVRELGLDPDDLPPRDRQRYWYTAIAQGKVDSAEARAAGDALARLVDGLGYAVGPAPGS